MLADLNTWLQDLFPPTQPGGSVGFTDLLLRLLVASALGAAIGGVYRVSQHKGSEASPSFFATLVLLCVLIALLTQVVGESAARAFSLVGILSIVRFRTTVEDTRDTAFVIFAVIVGMAAGVGNLQAAVTGLGVVGLAAVALRFIPTTLGKSALDWTLQMRVNTGAGGEMPWESVLAKHCDQSHLLVTTTARGGAALDVVYRLRLKAGVTPMQFLNDVNRIEGVQNVEMKRN